MSSTFLQDVVSAAAAPVLVAGRVVSDIVSSINPSISRLQSIGLNASGAQTSSKNTDIGVRFRDQNSNASTRDWRVRISLGQNDIFYNANDAGNGILMPLRETNGVVFPYTPQIDVNHLATYVAQRHTHSNYAQQFYEGSEIQSISIRGEFTAQTQDEAAYVLACIYFFRSATKMFFANSGKYTGNPPPIVYLNGYGDHYFPNVPCIITQFSHSMPNDVDYIESGKQSVQTVNNRFTDYELERQTSTKVIEGTRIPTYSQLSIVLSPVYSKRRTTEFDLNEFAKGGLIDKGFI